MNVFILITNMTADPCFRKGSLNKLAYACFSRIACGSRVKCQISGVQDGSRVGQIADKLVHAIINYLSRQLKGTAGSSDGNGYRVY